MTNHAPPHRVGAFAALHEREDVVFALVGGDVRHGGGGTGDGRPPVPASPRRAARRSRTGESAAAYRAVVAGLSGRVALPGAYAGARRAQRAVRAVGDDLAPPADAGARALLPALCATCTGDADAIVTYGPHVSDYVRRQGARSPVFEAPQAADTEFWSAAATEPRRQNAYQVLFVGRMDGEKGIGVLLQAWRASGSQGTPSRAGSGRRRAVPSPVLRHQRGAARRSSAAAGGA